jgi:peroxiredoxin
MSSSLSLRGNLAAGAVALAIGATAWWWQARDQAAPAVEYVQLDGSRHHSADWRGHVVLVNFWATSCAICVAEMPRLAALHERLAGQGLRTVAVSMHYDPPALVTTYAQRKRLPFEVAIDNTGAIERAFGGVQGTPTSFVIDRRGRIVRRIAGEPDFAELAALLERLLTQG